MSPVHKVRALGYAWEQTSVPGIGCQSSGTGSATSDHCSGGSGKHPPLDTGWAPAHCTQTDTLVGSPVTGVLSAYT